VAASLLQDEKVIGITGSVGKSTITSLIGEGLKSFDPHAFVGGNLGTAFCHYAIGLLQGKPRAQWIALELSSYQLENCSQLQLLASIISFLSPNHLERYQNLEEYYRTKLNITGLTRDICFVNATSTDAVKYSREARCAVKSVNAESFSPKELLGKIFLLGRHNRDNFALAASVAQYFLWPESSFKAMCQHKGLPHRLEFVSLLKGVTYINDSKATAMDSVLVAATACLENLERGHRIFLLLGGKDKNLPWEELGALNHQSESFNFVFFGQCGELAQKKSDLAGPYFEKLGSAVQYAQHRSQSGDIVLLSPGGTSLDEFRNFEERGNFFKSLVLA
jgi:UDP-N-acetylmuramoylalanine--D-glutamate ligase